MRLSCPLPFDQYISLAPLLGSSQYEILSYLPTNSQPYRLLCLGLILSFYWIVPLAVAVGQSNMTVWASNSPVAAFTSISPVKVQVS